MKYINAADVLPEKLLIELQAYVNGGMLYIPNSSAQKSWGEKSGSKTYYAQRNSSMKAQFKDGQSIQQIATEYGLAFDTVRKIIYS